MMTHVLALGIFESLKNFCYARMADLRVWLEWAANWLWDGMFDVLGYAWKWAYSILPEGFAQFIGKNPFNTTIYQMASDLNFFLPWKIALGIWIFATSVCVVIRISRWALGWSIAGVSVGA